MEIKIEGNPGTGNTFIEINIQHVDHLCFTTPSEQPSTKIYQQTSSPASTVILRILKVMV